VTEKPTAMILGTGRAVSGEVRTNKDLEKIVDTSDKWIREMTGIEQRYVLEEGKANSDLAAEAGQKAIADAGLTAEDIDLILIATITPDTFFPSTACRVQSKIGAKNAAAMDISAACSGFIYGISTANAMITAGQAKHVLVVGSEVLTRITDWEDRATCVLFGDGAGAAVLGPSDGTRGVLSTFIKADGRLGHLLEIPGGGSLHPATEKTIKDKLHYIKMEGQDIYKHAVRSMRNAALEGLKRADCQPEELDLLITHQANVRIIEALQSRLKMPDEKVFVNIQKFGNTSAASIPLALDQAREQGRLKDGDKCLLAAFGGGFTWGSTLIQF